MKILVGILCVAGIGFLAWYFLFSSSPIPGPLQDKEIPKLLAQAPFDSSEFGGTRDSVFEKGELNFSSDDGEPEGLASITDVYGAIHQTDGSDIFAVVNVSSGGTGVFQMLVWYEYDSNTNKIRELDQIFIGDRIKVARVAVNQSIGSDREVFVELLERLPGEPMSTEPSVPLVLHLSRGTSGGLEMREVMYGTIDSPQVVLSLPFSEKSPRIAARGNWFFEAQLTVALASATGRKIKSGLGTAQGEWMTENLVPFSVSYTDAATTTEDSHFFVVDSSNPSGEAKYQKTAIIPLRFRR